MEPDAEWQREIYRTIQRGTYQHQVECRHPRAWSNYDFSTEDGWHKISKAITKIFKRDYNNDTWLTKAQIYEKLRFDPMPTRQQFEDAMHYYWKRYKVWPWWAQHPDGHRVKVDYYILKDDQRDREVEFHDNTEGPSGNKLWKNSNQNCPTRTSSKGSTADCSQPQTTGAARTKMNINNHMNHKYSKASRQGDHRTTWHKDSQKLGFKHQVQQT